MENPKDEFELLLEKMLELHKKKGHDYGDRVKSYANCRRCEEFGIPAWKGVLIRISDKFSRIVTFAKEEKLQVSDESFEDTLVDMANYALICLILYRETKRINELSPIEFLKSSFTPETEKLLGLGIERQKSRLANL